MTVTLASLPLYGIMRDYNVEDMAMLTIYIVVAGMLLTASIECTATIRALAVRCCGFQRRESLRVGAAGHETQEGDFPFREERKIIGGMMKARKGVNKQENDLEVSEKGRIRRFFYK